MNNVKFATYIHILTLLATQKETYLSSEYIASSINIHPVIIRKALAELRDHGFLENKEGKAGGSRLTLPAKKIKLSEIYKLVNDIPALGKANTPNPDCPVGKQINKHLSELYTEAEHKLLKYLGKETLAGFSSKFK